MDNKEIINKVEKHVRGLYEDYSSDIFVYHNLEHVEKVVNVAGEIANHYSLNDQQLWAVLIAAWFHDVGYLLYHSNGHEEKSADLAIRFLKKENASGKLIENVREGILATRLFFTPGSLIAKIVADADLFNLGTPDFRKTNKKLWVEMKRCYGQKISTKEWYQSALELMEKHQYHTDYCRNLLREGKQKNIDYLRARLKENESSEERGDN